MEILKKIAEGILIQQGVNIGSKYISSKRITKNDEQGLALAFLVVLVLSSPNTQNLQPNN